MYGAVVCPRCRKGFAVDLERRTSSCPHCGRRIQVRRMKTHFTSESASLTAQAVRELNRRGRRLKVDQGPRERVLPMSPSRIETLVQDLGEFDQDELEAALGGRTAMEAEEILRRVLQMGLVYEVSPGRYRKA
ncbi:MAG: hypothetical protein JXA45_06670 [Methanomassiliicoccales archaeon]|nr:hypothetical protein [Methanomassiliicoccales archaeon]